MDTVKPVTILIMTSNFLKLSIYWILNNLHVFDDNWDDIISSSSVISETMANSKECLPLFIVNIHKAFTLIEATEKVLKGYLC